MRRPWLLPLNPLWGLGAGLKNYAYDHARLPIRALRKPVVSIGSLSAGGAGKTPIVIALARLLAANGVAADVLSRGYGRGSGAIEQVDPSGEAGRYGDEPLEIAQLNIPVFVGADRYAAGLLAEANLSSRVHLLDDGFQHRRLARALDIVLLTAQDTGDCLLPAGNLREPLRSLRRAGAVLLREEEAPALAPYARRHAPGVPQMLIRRELRLPVPPPQGALAFCGLARPEDFFSGLRQAGCTLSATIGFPDHYVYTSADMTALTRAARRAQAAAFLTTAKDAVKLPAEFRSRLEAAVPLHIVRLEVHFLDEPALLSLVRSRLEV